MLRCWGPRGPKHPNNATLAASIAIMTSPETDTVSPPIWLVVVWWVIMLIAAVLGFGMVFVLIAFGCDSGWQGCENASVVTVVLYCGIAALTLIGALIWAVTATTTGKRIIACVLMPVGVVLALAASWGYYWLMASRAGAG